MPAVGDIRMSPDPAPGRPGGVPDQVALPPRLVRALLLEALATPGGQKLWTGWVIGQDQVPWLQKGTFQLTTAQATVQRVELPPEARGEAPAGDGSPLL